MASEDVSAELDRELQERRARTDACMAEVQAVLDKHDCVITPTLQVEPVGSNHDRALLTTSWGIVAKVTKPE